MSTTKMIADMKFTYAGRSMKPGDEFTATERDALALTTFRRAHRAEGTTAELVAATRKPRRYRRRDMRAES